MEKDVLNHSFLSVKFIINIRTVHAIIQYLGYHKVYFLKCPMPTHIETQVASHVSITRAFPVLTYWGDVLIW